MSSTTLTLSSPNVALVAEIDQGSGSFPIVLTINNSSIQVKDTELVSHNNYSDIASAYAAAVAINSNVRGEAYFGEIEFTEVDVSDFELDFAVGDAATINYELSASVGTLAYQWYKAGIIIPGATSSSLSTASFQTGQAGAYICSVIATDSATTREARIEGIFTVSETPPAPPALTSATSFGA